MQECEAWLRQILALKQIVSQQIKLQTIKSMESSRKTEILNYLNSLVSPSDEASCLTYILVRNYQKALFKKPFNSVSMSDNLFISALQDFLGQTIFPMDLSRWQLD